MLGMVEAHALKGAGAFFFLLAANLVAPEALAQEQAPPPESVPLNGGNLGGMHVFPPPPAGFDPLTAPAQALKQFGFPPRPDQRKTPHQFAAWRKLATAPQHRLAPRLEATTLHNGRARDLLRQEGAAPTLAGNATQASSSNWSGYAILDPANPFLAGTNVYGEWVVPVAQQAPGECSGGWSYASQWVGLDGFVSSDVLQAGIEADAFCAPQGNGTNATSAFYSAWFEWFPNSETRIANFAIHPGDLVGVQVWNSGATGGNAYVVDYTTQQSVSLSFAAPAGTSLVGDSVEWVVERPEVNGATATLTHYVADPFNFCHAAQGDAAYAPGESASGTAYAIDMVDGGGDTASTVSSPNLYGTMTLWFYEPGPAEQ